MILAALCLSALTLQPGVTTAYRCPATPGGLTVVDKTPPVSEPVAVAPEQPKPKAKTKVFYAKSMHRCPAGKRAYFHRRKSKTWWTCS